MGIWRLGKALERVNIAALDNESKLEDTLVKDLSILSPGLMLIGRQVPTAFGKFIDLLAMDMEGNFAVVELKRDRTPRDVVAQLLDYGSWIKSLSFEEIADIYAERNDGKQFDRAFAERFG